MGQGKRVIRMSEINKSVQQVQEASETRGVKSEYIKLKSGMNKILLLPPSKEGTPLIKRVLIHQVWKGGKPILTASSPRGFDEEAEDEIMVRGFELREKYLDSSSKKKQEMFKRYMPRDEKIVQALDLSEKNPTPKLLRLPNNAFKFLCDELREIKNPDEIFDLDKGLPLVIKGNGQEGKNRRYDIVKWSKEQAKLLARGLVDEDAIFNNLIDLDLLMPKPSEKKLKKIMLALKKQDQMILGKEADDEDEEEVDEDDEDSADEVDGEDDDEEEKPSKKSKKKPSKSDDDDDSDEEDSEDPDDEDEEEESEEDDSDDDDFSDDDDKKSSTKKKPKKKPSKSDDDDEDDSDDDEDEDSDDEEVEEADFDDDDDEEKPKKKKIPGKKKK